MGAGRETDVTQAKHSRQHLRRKDRRVQGVCVCVREREMEGGERRGETEMEREGEDREGEQCREMVWAECW